MAEHLISIGGSVRPPGFRPYYRLPLRVACEHGQDDSVPILLYHGARICGRELEAAITHGHTSTVNLLLQHIPEVNSIDAERCLYLAARKGFLGIFKMLLNAGLGLDRAQPAPIIGPLNLNVLAYSSS